MSPNLPYLTYTDIGRKAQEFLSQFHPSLDLPIPLGQLGDKDYFLEIVKKAEKFAYMLLLQEGEIRQETFSQLVSE